jgi:hypothetical protein
VAVSEGFGWVVYLGNEGQGRGAFYKRLFYNNIFFILDLQQDHVRSRSQSLEAL